MKLNEIYFNTPYTAKLITMHPTKIEELSLICEYNELKSDEYFRLKIELSKALEKYSLKDFDNLRVDYTSTGKIRFSKVQGQALDTFLQDAGLQLEQENPVNFLYDLDGFHQKYERARKSLSQIGKKKPIKVQVIGKKISIKVINKKKVTHLPRVFEPLLWLVDRFFKVALKDKYTPCQ